MKYSRSKEKLPNKQCYSRKQHYKKKKMNHHIIISINRMVYFQLLNYLHVHPICRKIHYINPALYLNFKFIERLHDLIFKGV